MGLHGVQQKCFRQALLLHQTPVHNPACPYNAADWQIDVSTIGVQTFEGPNGPFDVDVFDSAADYIAFFK